MIGRASFAQGLYICSRCRLKLSRQVRPRSRFRFYTLQHRNKQQDEQGEENEHDAQNLGHGPSIRHLNLHEDRITLPIDALGQPAAIRVLRDKPLPPRDEVQGEEATEDESLEDFLRDTVARAGTSSNNEAVENIDQLRKAFLEKLQGEDPSLEDCQALGQSLQDGFTSPHLKAYVQRRGAAITTAPYDLDALYVGDSYRRSRWFAGESDFPDQRRLDLGSVLKIEDILDIVPFDSESYKARMVKTIIRNCWALRIRDERELLGSVEIKLDTRVLDVLLKNNDQVFDRISRAHRAKIDVAPSLGILRVHGNYEVCESVLEAIVASLQSVRADTFKVELGIPPKLCAALLKFIELNTNTRILPRDKSVDIFYFLPEALDDARRLIKQMKEYFDEKRPYLKCFPTDIVPILVPIEADPSLGFAARQEKWYRWRDRSMGWKDSGTLAKLTMPASKSLIIQDLRKRFRGSANTVESEHWRSTPEQTVSATFGNIAHSIAKPAQLLTKLYNPGLDKYETRRTSKRVFAKLIQHRRAFVAKAPSVLPVVNELATKEPTLSTSILITLKPDIDTLPRLDLEVLVDSNKRVTELCGANLAFDIRTFDLLLPAQSVDIRYLSRTSFVATPENFDPAILTFLANSNIDVWGTERLRTPQGLVLSMPGHESTSEQTKAHYSVASLAVCSNLRTTFQGFPLTLSTIEAGRSGGRREELKLDFHGYPDLVGDAGESGADREAPSEPLEVDPPPEQEALTRWDAEFLMWYGTVKDVVSRIPY